MRFISGPTSPTDSERYSLQGDWGSADMLWSNGERIIDHIDEHEFRSDVKRFYNDRDELIAVTYQINSEAIHIVYDLGSCDAAEIIGNCFNNYFSTFCENEDRSKRQEILKYTDFDVFTIDLKIGFKRDDSRWFLEVWDADWALDMRD